MFQKKEYLKMDYYYSIKVNDTFENTRKKVTDALAKEGFGVLTEINLKETFKKKLGVDFRQYVILGACNPTYSFKAIQAEDNLGTLLPCNVILQESGKDFISVAAVNPVESMKMVNNPEVEEVAGTIRQKLVRALESIR